MTVTDQHHWDLYEAALTEARQTVAEENAEHYSRGFWTGLIWGLDIAVAAGMTAYFLSL